MAFLDLSSTGLALTLVLLLQPCSSVYFKKLHSKKVLTDKPQGDTRRYQHLVLPNGLQVLNVQDERALETAFAMAVQSGSFNDPEAFPGLAHFCEHMVFLGTEKYPEPSGFDNFMGANGGSNNAYTSSDLTVYFGQITGSAGHEAMDRFADFFRAPLFNRSFVEKEVHAIDSEHAKNVQSPTQRIVETFYSLSNPESPMSRFHTGNLETLFEAPMARNENPVDALEVYFKRYYCPSKMRLVTFSSAPLAEQHATAEELFGSIPHGSDECRSSPVMRYSTPDPWGGTHVGNFLHIQGTQPSPALWLHFPLPELSKNWASSPMSYINYVMSYNGVDSISRTLTDKLGLATDCGGTMDENSAGTQFFYVVTLTQKGLKDPSAVMDVVFSYLAKMRHEGVDEALYQSIANISRLQWDWGEMSGPMSTVEELAAEMTHPSRPLDNVLASGRIDNPDVKLVASLMERLSPQNLNAALVHPPAAQDGKASVLANGVAKHLPFYNVTYRAQDLTDVIEQERIDKWQNWLKGATLAKEAGVLEPRVPGEIKDVPTEIPQVHMHAAKPDRSTEGFDASIYGPKPQNVSESLWYRSGWVTSSPKVSVYMTFRPSLTPKAPETTPLDSMRLTLYNRLLSEEMTPKMVDLIETGVTYGVDVSPSGISLTFSGFEPLMPRLVDHVLSEFHSFNSNRSITDPQRFERVINDVNETLSTYDGMPVSYANSDMSLLLVKGGHSNQEKMSALQEVTLPSMASAGDDLILSQQLQLTSMAMGNLAQSAAESVVKQCADQVQSAKRKAELQAKDGEVETFPPVVDPQQPIELRKLNPRGDDPNDVAVVALLHGVKTIESRVMLSLIGQILSTVAYNELRTVRQLGYVVQGGSSSFSNVLAVKVMVQGTVLDADEAEAAIQAVITDFMPRRLETIKESELESMKSALVEELKAPPVGISEEVGHFWGPVRQGGLCFGLQDHMLNFLNTTNSVTREKLATMWAELATPKEGLRKKVTVKYFSGEVPPTPSANKYTEMWHKQGVPKHHQKLLEDELKQTRVLDVADSATRKELLKGGSYFPKTLNC